MYACIHASADPARLVECAQAFSPVVEQAQPDIAVLDASGLDRIYGPPHEVAAAISARAREMGFTANIALASHPDTAICAARGFSGISIVPHGDEAKFLESLPVHLLGLDEQMSETFDRWGIRTFRDLAVLPTIGIAGRLGPEGVRLQALARGECERPLVAIEAPLRFAEELQLDDPVELLEPLLFVLGRLLNDLCRRLAGRGLAANELRLRLALEDKSEHQRTLRFPVPMCDPRTFLKLLQLDLGRHPPAAPVLKVGITAEHSKPRTAPEGLFIPQAPEPEKLELTLARVTALVGEKNVGSPELQDSHRPDAFQIHRFAPPPSHGRGSASVTANGDRERAVAAYRRYRPPKEAQVQTENERPIFVHSADIRGKIISCAGPWRTSGDWWTLDPWNRDEWDIALHTGALYRIYYDHVTGRWFVEGSFD